jgi:CheY-like chemotaxis protein
MEIKRILVVDDEPAITRMIRMALAITKRYEVREENQALHAHTTAREFRPDVILLDVVMPGIDGGELANRFKNDPQLKEVPLIFLTGTLSKREATEGVIQGGYLFLPKPVGLKNLVESIENALAAKAHAAKSEPSAKPSA